MKWDGGYVTMGSSLLAHGSTENKTISRALGGGGSDAAAGKVMPIAGCVCAAVAHDGRMHVMSVSFPAIPGVTQQFFAFATAVARDAFMRELAAAEAKAAAAAVAAAPAIAHALQSMQLQVPSLPAQPEPLLMNVLLLLAVLNRFRIEPLSLTARCSTSWPPFLARA